MDMKEALKRIDTLITFRVSELVNEDNEEHADKIKEAWLTIRRKIEEEEERLKPSQSE